MEINHNQNSREKTNILDIIPYLKKMVLYASPVALHILGVHQLQQY